MDSTEKQRLFKLLSKIYGEDTAQQYKKRLSRLITENPIPPRDYQMGEQDVVLIAFADHINKPGQAPLATLHHFCEKYLKDVINTIHILPFYPFTSDRGFAVSDYLSVKPEFGTWKDVEDFSQDFSLMFDGVFNHVSASHKWFQKFLADDPKYRDYFVALPPDTDVSSVTRPRTTPLLTPFATKAGTKHVWTTFSADQIDLNYGNPEVLMEVLSAMLEYVRHGANLIRLDAIGFIWRDPASNSMHHPKAHDIIRLMHEILKVAAPWVWLVPEINVPHYENLRYFGNGHDQAQMIYNFALPPLVVHTMQTGSSAALNRWAPTLATPSDETTFFNFTASHDGIGLRGVTTILTDDEIRAMSKRIEERGGLLSMRTDAAGKEAIYEMNISYLDAVSDPEAPLKTQVDQFICSQAIALSMAGVPGIYLHSILGSTNWSEGVEEEGYNRAINEEKLDLGEVERELEDPRSRRRMVFDHYTSLLRVRRDEPAFSPTARQKVLNLGPEVFAVERATEDGKSHVLALHNVSSKSVQLHLDKSTWSDLLSGNEHKHYIELQPYQVVWLKEAKLGAKVKNLTKHIVPKRHLHQLKTALSTNLFQPSRQDSNTARQ